MIQTCNGRVINPLDFHRDQISVEEIAHALACQNRFFGHARFPISIAQHAVSVSKLAMGHEMQGLHHDDSEAMLGDINKWLKQQSCFSEYRRIEDVIQTELFKKFDCPVVMAKAVVEADQFAVRCEMSFAFGRYYKSLHVDYAPPSMAEMDYFLDYTGFCEMSWQQARDLYLERHLELETRTARYSSSNPL